MIRMREICTNCKHHYKETVAYKCYYDYHNVVATSNDKLPYEIVFNGEDNCIECEKYEEGK